jgi:Holliday junction resolvasome RuvABC endonuclease subunit
MGNTLALDLSFTSTGISVLDNNNSILLAKHLPTDKKLTTAQRVKTVIDEVNTVLDGYNIKRTFIEDYSRQCGLKTQIHTLQVLAALNVCVQYSLLNSTKLFNVIPVQTVRARVKRLAKYSTTPKKDQIPDVVSKIITVPTWLSQFETKKYYLDIMDSLALNIAGRDLYGSE